MDPLLAQWNQTYFDGQLSTDVLYFFDKLALSTQKQLVQDILERQFRMLRATHHEASDFTVDFARNLYALLNLFSTIDNNTQPPVTFPGRHEKLDSYISCNRWWQCPARGKLLDIGCGFPPLTTVETAEKYKDWQIIGADPLIPHFIVHNEHQDYATFSKSGDLLYFHGYKKRFDILCQDPAGTRAYFNQLFDALTTAKSELKSDQGNTPKTINARLTTDPIQAYELPNLSFETAAIGKIYTHAVDMIRCMNVLLYFDRSFRRDALTWFSKILREGGLLLCGTNSGRSLSSRYTIFQKEKGELIEREFAFGIDNIRISSHPAPWWAFHNDEIELNRQAVLTAEIRSDVTFRQDLNARLDELFAEHELFFRKPDGHLMDWESGMPDDKNERLVQVHEQLDQEGYVQGAANILIRAGYDAWRNCIGHIAVNPAGFND